MVDASARNFLRFFAKVHWAAYRNLELRNNRILVLLTLIWLPWLVQCQKMNYIKKQVTQQN
jgi:hypothetical protein